MKLAITGGSGFIGRNLYERLHERFPGSTVRIIDLEQPKFALRDDDEVIVGDIRDGEKVRTVLDGADILIHLAAAHKDVGISKEEYFDINENGTRLLLAACAERGIKRVIFTSSVAIFGKTSASDDTPPEPTNFYGQSKLAAEKVCREFAGKDPDLKIFIIRPAVVVGRYNVANMYNLISVIDQGKKIFYIDCESKIKSFASVYELCDLIYFSIGKDLSFLKQNIETMNFVSYPQMPVRKICDIICEELGRRKPLFTVPLSFLLIAGHLFALFARLFRIKTPINVLRIKKLGTQTCFEAPRKETLRFTAPQEHSEQALRGMVSWYDKEGRSWVPNYSKE